MLQLFTSLALSLLTLATPEADTTQVALTQAGPEIVLAVTQFEEEKDPVKKNTEADEHCQELCEQLTSIQGLPEFHRNKANFLNSVADDLAEQLGEDDPLVQIFRNEAQEHDDLADNYELQAQSIMEELEALDCDCDCQCSKGDK